jgi:endonuclease-3 related protein
MGIANGHSVIEIFNALYSIYGPQEWWPGDSQFEIMVGAILTQNTAWRNVSLAIDNLKSDELLDLVAFLEAEPERVKTLIAPAGYFNVKYKRLRSFLEYLKDTDPERFRSAPVDDLRSELLGVNGIGPETADSILLYAFDRPVFVVDSYTRRLFSRLGYGWMEKAPYEEVQEFFMRELPSESDLYNEFHALIVAHCKNICKKKPLCSACAISSQCAEFHKTISETSTT